MAERQRGSRYRYTWIGLFGILAWLSATPSLLAVKPDKPQRGNIETWTEDSFEDFAAGTMDDGGQNLYVSRDGKVRTIHRYDLNQDGHLDLLFNSTHDLRNFVAPTLGTVSSDRRTLSSTLAVRGSKRVVLADLNRDGYLEAVFCPNYSGLQSYRRFLTILWGGKDGWPPRRSNGLLPVHKAADVAVADLNKDQWSDIVILNGKAWLPGQPEGRILRIYWGGPHGFSLQRRQDVGVPDALEMAAADFDADGSNDLAVLQSGGGIHLLWSTAAHASTGNIETSDLSLADKRAQCITAADVSGDGRSDLIVGTGHGADVLYLITAKPGRAWNHFTNVPAFAASQITVGDLDGDARLDLVLTDFAQDLALGGEATGSLNDGSGGVHILWASKGEYSKDLSMRLPVRDTTSTAIGDLDGDGRADLVLAIYQGPQTFATESLVFFGTGQRRLVRGPHGLRSEGAMDIAVAPPEKNLPARAIFANSVGGTVNEKVPLYLYWGGPRGFDVEHLTKIPFRSGYEATTADLNADGFVDLVAINSQHGGAAARRDPNGGANIFWGSAKGFDFQRRRTVVREALLGCSNTADLNRDGYLDLVLGVFDTVKPNQTTPLIIRYGSAEGFTSNGRVALPCPGRSIGTVIADFNQDGWLDLAASSMFEDRVRIFWGSAEGYDAKRQTQLEVPAPIAMETADLNSDGHLDLIVGSYKDPVTHAHDMGTMIYLGGSKGFREWDAQWLPGRSPLGHCVADFDGDGHLDLFTPHYLGENTRETIPSFLYWGGLDGFSPKRRTSLICDSASDALAGDFDRDGLIDLAVSCHTKDGDHSTNSLVFYNDGRRFAQPRTVRLPTAGPHWMWLQDMGHIYHRRWQHTYQSSVYRLRGSRTSGRLDFRAEVPAGTRLTFAIRAAKATKQLADAPWRPVREDKFSLAQTDRYLQYRAVLLSDNGDRYPVLDKVEIVLAH